MLVALDAADQSAKWIALVGDVIIALGAFGGVLLTAVIALRRYREEQQGRADDRELEIRKKLMVRGVRGLLHSAQVLGAAANLSIDSDELDKRLNAGGAEFMTAMSMASVKTAELAKEAHLAILRRYLEIKRDRAKLVELHDHYLITTRLLEAQGETNDRLFRQQEAMMLSDGQEDKILLAQKFIEVGRKAFDEIREDREKALHELEAARTPFAIENLNKADDFMPKLYELIGCIRADLGIKGSADEFVQAAQITAEDMRRMLEDVYSIQLPPRGSSPA